MSFNQIFKNKLIYYPKLRAINCHAGKLPYYRGRNVLNWALINDEKEFGITVHYIDEGIDTGDILSQQMYPITDKDNYATLLEVAHRECASLLYQTIKQLQTGTIIQIKQSSIAPDGFYCTARKVGDERLNWHQNSRDIFNFIRGLCCPGPEARTFYGEQEIKINCAEFLPHLKPHKGIPGAIVGIDSNSFYVKTLDTYIKVTDWSGINKLKIGARLS